MMRMPFAILLPVAILSGRVVGGTVPAASPQEMAAALERRIVSGDGVTLPDAERGIARVAGTVDLAAGDWPEAFLARAGESVCVAVSPFTGCYEFFDETGEVFWTVVPVLPTTENWVAPFRHAEDGPHPDDGLYAPWRLVDVWLLSTTEHTENTEGGGGASSPSKPRHLESHAEFAESAEIFDLDFGFLDNDGLLRFVNNPRGAAGPATNLCITAFSFTETNLFFTAAWPTNEPLPDSTLDLYGSTNLLSPSWTFLSSHPATNPPVEFAVAHASLPWYVEPMQHVHDATCESITNVVASPLDGVTVYTNVFWSCSTNRSPGECGFFRLGTHLDTDGDGLFDAWETLVAGTDPANPDTDGDGVPDGRTAAEWLSHPLWADNGDCTNLVVFLYEPVTNGVAALRFDDLCIPLASNAGPWHLCIPTNAVVDCRLVLGEGAGALLGYGPPEAVVPMRSSGLGLVLPDEIAVPIWCDRPWSVFGGASRNGSCRFARPSLSVRSEETGQASPLNVCIHDPSGIARFSWSVEPPVCTGLCASATGAAWMFDAGTFFIDASDALPGEAETLAGTVVVASEQPPFFGNNVLFGTLRETVFAHLCAGQSDRYCLSCGVAHGAPESARACFHDPWCATKTNLLADCDCAESFVRIGGCGVLRVIGEAVSCCHAHDFFSSRAELLSAPDALGASLSDGRFLGVAPESRSPTIGGFVANCRILGWDDAPFRDVPIRFTCADLGIVPDFADVSVPGDVPPSEYFITNGTLHVARRAAPYPIRLWNESPSDARLVFSFDSPTNGPALFDSSLVTRHSSLVTTNAAPFSALNDDRTVYLDASCSNALATLSLALSDPATNRTFLSESLSVRVVDTAIREEWRVRSATARIAWDFSDAPEDVWIGVGHAGPDGVLTNTLESASSRTPSLSLGLPPGDYALEAYFPRVYDGVSAAAWSTNTLHILDNPAIVSLDGCDSLNEAAHHTTLYETNALVVRRAQSFRFKTTVTKWFNPARHELRFFLADDFDGHWTTNEVLPGTGIQPMTEWFYRTVSTTTEVNGDITLVSDIYCATTNCPVGAYRIGARLYDSQTNGCLDERELNKDLIVLFNPWSNVDSVYMGNDSWRNECVLAQSGKIWIGTRNKKVEKSWKFDQFAEVSLAVVLRKLTRMHREARSDPSRVGRWLSWCVNSADNPTGIVRGKWEGDYSDGTHPATWRGSLPIFSRHLQSGVPVQYGQCFVFAGVLTSCMRCLGVPCRPVTNYDSGHDRENDGFVDYRMISRTQRHPSSDKIWNYHVWTECWIIRMTETGDDFWQIIDGTPQEKSQGKYQCGPARRVAVNNLSTEPYDTVFVIGEVSGRLRKWKNKTVRGFFKRRPLMNTAMTLARRACRELGWT